MYINAFHMRTYFFNWLKQREKKYKIGSKQRQFKLLFVSDSTLFSIHINMAFEIFSNPTVLKNSVNLLHSIIQI